MRWHRSHAPFRLPWQVLAALALVALLGACANSSESRATEHEPKHIQVQALAQSLSANACTALDVNTPAVRTRHGRIPQARLLSDYRQYSLDELPDDRDRPLVFYCANERCSASDAAARRALQAGYRDVSVLRAGIAGWAKAGQQTLPVE